jgi:acyl-CoA reductase-like NAD-dependent aldehyde dehydrogenase
MGNYPSIRVPLSDEDKGDMMDSPVPDVVEIAAKEVDQDRRHVNDVIEQMRGRQNYFYERAQMYREAASHYEKMSEDLAGLLNNEYLNSDSKKAY